MSGPQKTLTPKTAVIMGLLIGESDWLMDDHYRLVQLILCTNLKGVEESINHVQYFIEDEDA